MALCRLFLLLLLLSSALAAPKATEDVLQAVEIAWKITSSEVVIFTDNQNLLTARKLVKELMKVGIPVNLFAISELLLEVKERKREACPVIAEFGNVSISGDKTLMKRNSIIMKESKHAKSVFFLMSEGEVESGLQLITSTVWECPQTVDFGIFSENSKIFFVVDQVNILPQLLDHHWLKKHPYVYFVYLESLTQSSLLYCSMPCNALVYSEHLGFVSNMRDEKIEARTLKMLKDPKHFFNKRLTGTTLVGDVGPNATVTNRAHTYEFRLLSIIEKDLNFSTTIVNSYQGISYIGENGDMGGSAGIMLRHEADVALNFGSYLLRWNKVSRPSHIVHKTPLYLSLVAPLPKPFPKTWTIIRPFQPWVWIGLILSLLFTPIVLSTFATIEEKLKRREYAQYSSVMESAWYCIGTLCGESITDLNSYANSNALRINILIWLYFCFLMTAAYAGCLYSFMANPGTQPPINSLQDAIASNLRVDWALYHIFEESQVQFTTDTDLRALWERKQAFSFFRAPFDQPMRRALNGESVVVGFTVSIRKEIATSQSSADGAPLVHWARDIDLDVIVKTHMVILMPILSPYGRRMKSKLLALSEGGITDYEDYTMLMELRKNYLSNGGHIPTLFQRDSYDAFTLDDVQGYLYFFGVFSMVSIVAVLIEVAFYTCLERKWVSKTVK